MMPSAPQILTSAIDIANRAVPFAVAWHVAFGLGIVLLWSGFRPSRRAAAVFLALPIGSVAAAAWTFGNPFNGAVFSVLAVALLAAAMRLPATDRAVVGRGPVRGAGALMLVFGWTYPHFLQTDTAWAYLYASPLGLLPCPTLSAVIGLTLVLTGLGSRLWSSILAGAGFMYAVFGTLRLGVWLDVGLLAGSVALWASRPSAAARSVHEQRATGTHVGEANAR